MIEFNLLKLWTKRFCEIFTAVCLFLALVEISKHGPFDATYGYAVFWASLTSLTVSSFGAYWAHRTQCKKVYPQETEKPNE